jgi:hypothetical protein
MHAEAEAAAASVAVAADFTAVACVAAACTPDASAALEDFTAGAVAMRDVYTPHIR